MLLRNRILVVVFATFGLALPAAAATVVISNVLMIDGSGGVPYPAEVAVTDGTISVVGAPGTLQGDLVIDGGGMALAPGFIDTHSHHDRGLGDERTALAAVSQGVTTIVVGQDGSSQTPLADFFADLDARPAAVNVASFSGHNTLRSNALGESFQRTATAAEIEAMTQELRADMAAGALGLATGLEYDPGIYSEPSEVLALASAAAEHAGARYISHIRSEDRHFFEAIDELINIGRVTRMPVQVSHVKLAMRSLWGQTDELLRRLDAGRRQGIDVTADIYPYEYWQSTVKVLFPERDFDNRETAAFVLDQIVPADGLVFTTFDPEPRYVNKSLATISTLMVRNPVDSLLEMLRQLLAYEERTGRRGDSVTGKSMRDEDIARIMRWPHTNFCTDGSLRGTHPRGFGAFPRALGHFSRERADLTLGETVRKMTSLAASHMGIERRGRIAAGYAADLVLFDPAEVSDAATPAEPNKVSRGIARVWVNGVEVFASGRVTGALPGRVLRRGQP